MKDLYNCNLLEHWDRQEAGKNLLELYNQVLEIADSYLGWYRNHRRKKGLIARTVRLSAIILFVVSSLMPYFASLGKEVSISNTFLLYVGYILAGLGAGLLFMDRYYGFSSSWTRFALIALDIEMMRNMFVEHWKILCIKNSPLTVERFCILIEAVSKFRTSISDAVRSETNTWAKETQQNLSELMQALKNQSEQLKVTLDEQQLAGNKSKDLSVSPSATEISEQIFEEAKRENAEIWKKEFGVIGVGHGRKITDGEPVGIYSLIFYPAFKLDSTKDKYNTIPKFIDFKGYKLPTDVRALEGTMRASQHPKLLCDVNRVKRPGCSISRLDEQVGSGTIGLIVYRGKRQYLLSCYHVLCQGELNANFREFDRTRSIGSTAVVSPSNEDEQESSNRIRLGIVVEGELTAEIDGAIVEIDNQADFVDRICALDIRTTKTKSISKIDADQHLPVRSVGRTSGIINGVIEAHSNDYDVEYFIEDKWQVVKLINLIKTDQRTSSGDSGAVVVDYDNNVIGLIVATSPNATGVVPIQPLLEKFQVTLNPQNNE